MARNVVKAAASVQRAVDKAGAKNTVDDAGSQFYLLIAMRNGIVDEKIASRRYILALPVAAVTHAAAFHIDKSQKIVYMRLLNEYCRKIYD